MTATKSIEEQVEDIGKRWLDSYGVMHYSKTQTINPEIAKAMKDAPSKTGGTGTNYPDIRCLLETSEKKTYPIMIEVKGKRGFLERLNSDGSIDNTTKKGEPNYGNINNYAANGAIHYADAIINFTESYDEVIAIGLNGYMESGDVKSELSVWFVSRDNLSVPKKVGTFTDLSFLAPDNFDAFIEQVHRLQLTAEELEAESIKIEQRIETNLKSLNQAMQDDLRISVGSRVELITGMIMAGLGVKGEVAPLQIADLRGETGKNSNDGEIILRKIEDFLTSRDLPQEKKEMIVNDLARVFRYADLSKPENDESKLKTVYTRVKNDILPIFTSSHHLDFTGKLFNVLNEWVDIPDSDKNDVVLTPRYVTEMMAKLAKVDRNSYVWDYATGSAGFLISSMKLMVDDAEKNIASPAERNRKIAEIKARQLLGIEKRSDIYLLAVLNMILMGDGSSNILHEDSLTGFKGNYEQGAAKNTPFPANVFLLNPPYSADGKGFIFVKKALSRMKSGRAVVLIQENAGSGKGLPYTKELLDRNTLVASIHMSDIFLGKAGVQTAIYVFDVGKTHDPKQLVKFIDMSDDGYERSNRKKSISSVNLRDARNASERYQEVVDLVNFGKTYLQYFTDADYIEDTISPNGDDWTFAQHKKIDTRPTDEDFMKVVSEYLAWEVGEVLKGSGRV